MPAERSGEGVQLERLSPTHEMIALWLLANPGKGAMARCAAHFGYTPAWLASVVHSDAFQAYYRDRRDDLMQAGVMDISEKVTGVADRALDKLAEKVETASSLREIADTTDKLLHRLGYGVAQGGVTINQNDNREYHVRQELYTEARQRMHQKEPIDGPRTLNADGEARALPAPGEDAVSIECDIGALGEAPAAVPTQADEDAGG
jgi:hypothetical protein